MSGHLLLPAFTANSMVRKLLPLILTALMCVSAAVQAQRVSDWLRLAEEALADGDVYGAQRYMEEVMALDSARAHHNYLYAEVLRSNHRYAKSAYYYNKIYRRDQGRQYPEAGIWLASMLKQQGKYPESKAMWRRVRDQYADQPDGYWYRKAVQEMRSCDLASVWMQEYEGFEMEPLAVGTNTEGSEWAGAVMPGGNLVFSGLRGNADEKGRITAPESYFPRLYFAKGDDWKHAAPLPMLSTGLAETNFAVNADSSLRAMSVVHSTGLQEIHISGGHFGEGWQRLLPPAGDDTSWYSQPAFGILNGVEVLFFSSDREGGEGGRDIWYLPLDAPGAAAVNAGSLVNTPGDEITPFFREDKEQLYFASDWHHGFGGFDLFVSTWGRGGFAVPQNMRKPWNTPSNDLYYRFGAGSHAGTITSNRPEAINHRNEGCCNDLWRFEEAPYEYTDTLHIMTLEQLNDYLPVTLFFHNDEPNPRSWSDTTAQAYFDTYYAYTDMLPQYQFEYRKGLADEEGVLAEEAMDRFFLDRVDKGVSDLAAFTPLLLQELREGQEIQLTIKGYASPLARTDYNVKLTSRRIASLVNYLYQYDGGVLIPYLEATAADGGRLDIVRIPFGEYTAQNLVSDNPNETNAIWSIAAALERKIEISSVQRAPSDSSQATLRFASEIADLGSVPPGKPQVFTFAFEVSGSVDFVPDSISFDRTSMTLETLETRYAAGNWGVINGSWHGNAARGKLQLRITLHGNVAGGSRELNVVMEVE